MHVEQQENLDRVQSKIEGSILRFASEVVRSREPTFHMADLLARVREDVPETAPDSPSRILRLLRQAKKLDYEVINRRDSHYKLLSVGKLRARI